MVIQHQNIDDDAPRIERPDPVLATARMQIDRAGWASRKFSRFSRKAVLAIAEAVARTAHESAGEYAKWAVEETGFGVVEHKKIKNELTAWPLLDHYRDLDLVSPRIVEDRKMVEFPKPAGVIFALTPATNPVATLNYKVLLAILSRNVIIISPHPRAAKCCVDAARRLEAAAVAAGAPAGIIQCVENPSIPVVQALMSNPKVSLVLATGGGAMVRAAYSSSNPAIGVGPGNAPVYIHPSADISDAAAKIVESKSFDNSVLCTNESVLIVEEKSRNRLELALRQAGAHVLSPQDAETIRDFIFPDGQFNLDTLGQSAVKIAGMAGIRVAPSTKILVAPVMGVGPDEALTREKLCPVVALVSVDNQEQAISTAQIVLRGMGSGHSAVFHGKDQQAAAEYASRLPVYRVVVNAPCSQGASGFATFLAPSFTIGTGYLGRSSIGENIGPEHLVHWTRLACHKDEPFGDYSGIELDYLEGSRQGTTIAPVTRASLSVVEGAASSPSASITQDANREMIRELILHEIRDLLGDKR